MMQGSTRRHCKQQPQTVVRCTRHHTCLCVVAALMQNQVEGFQTAGLSAAALSSATPAAERESLLADISSNAPATKLLFVTPELLTTEG